MAQKVDEKHAACLWEMVGVSVTNCLSLPKQHKGDVMFAGYFDLQIWLFADLVPGAEREALPLLQLCGNSLKTIKGKVHFDPKSEPAKDSRPGNRSFFNHWFPSSAAAREVLTRKLLELPEIQELVRKSGGMPTSAAVSQ
jgi:hypothetical protein